MVNDDGRLSDDELAYRREHRAAEAARRAERDEVPRLDVQGWVPKEGSHLARAMRRLADPEARRQIDAQIAAEKVATYDEVQAMRRANRFARYDETRPSMYRTATYADLDPADKGAAKVRGWWRSGAKTLVIAGEPGRGKTHAAYAVCNEVAADDRDGHTTVPAEVRSYLTSGLRELLVPPAQHVARDEVASARRARALDDVRTANLLLLDDMTAAQVTDWFRESLHSIIDARVTGRAQRTIVTVNAPARSEFAKVMLDRLGAAIVSRLNDDAVYVWLDGPDRRLASTWDPFA